MDNPHLQSQLLAQKLQIILESIPSSLIVTDVNGIVTNYSKFLGRVIGPDKIGLPFEQAFPYDPVKHTLVTLRTGREFNNDLYHFIREGKDNIVRTSTRRLLDADGNLFGVLSFSVNITEEAVLGQKLQVLQQLELQGELAASTAHEIRNPVTTIRGFLELLSLDLAHDAEKSEYLRLMLTELDSIETTISRFLELTRTSDLALSPIGTAAFIAEALPSLATQVAAAGGELTLAPTAADIPVVMDSHQIRQVLLSTVGNSIQAFRPAVPGLVELGIFADATAIASYLEPFAHYAQSLTFTLEPDTFCLTIRDNGRGIPADRLHKLGTIFYSTKTAGTGVGLTLSQKVVSEHGGQIGFFSREGEGTIVIVKLPRRPAAWRG